MLSGLSQKGKQNDKKPIRVLHVGSRQPSFLLSRPGWLHGGWGIRVVPSMCSDVPLKPHPLARSSQSVFVGIVEFL